MVACARRFGNVAPENAGRGVIAGVRFRVGTGSARQLGYTIGEMGEILAAHKKGRPITVRGSDGRVLEEWKTLQAFEHSVRVRSELEDA